MSTIGKGIKALMGLGGNKQQQRQSQQQVDEQQQPAYLPVKDLVKDGAGRPVPADYAAGGGRPSASDVVRGNRGYATGHRLHLVFSMCGVRLSSILLLLGLIAVVHYCQLYDDM
jgi:hypothetical protein